jgi:hypothetical protein
MPRRQEVGKMLMQKSSSRLEVEGDDNSDYCQNLSGLLRLESYCAEDFTVRDTEKTYGTVYSWEWLRWVACYQNLWTCQMKQTVPECALPNRIYPDIGCWLRISEPEESLLRWRDAYIELYTLPS